MHTDLADPRIINPSIEDEDRAYKRALAVEDETFAMMTDPVEVASILDDIGPEIARRLAAICDALEKAPYCVSAHYRDVAVSHCREIHKSIKSEAKYRAELAVAREYGDE